MKAGVVALGVSVAAFGVLMAPTAWAMLTKDIRLPPRDLFFQALYGIHLPDVFIPKIPLLTGFYDRYAAAQNVISSEGNYAVLGLWGLIGLLYGLWVCLRRLFPNLHKPCRGIVRRASLLRMSSFLFLFGILFALPYGLGFIFNMLVSGVVRSQNRIGVFLIFFAIIMTAVFFEKMRGRMSQPKYLGLAGIVFLVTLIPSFHALDYEQQKTLGFWKENETSLMKVLGALDGQKLQKVAQFPSIYYPEGPPMGSFGNTSHFWPYLMDGNAARKWSFGSMMYQSLWEKLAVLWQQTPDIWIRELGMMGYDAVLIEKQALPNTEMPRMEELHGKAFAPLILYEDSLRLLMRVPGREN